MRRDLFTYLTVLIIFVGAFFLSPKQLRIVQIALQNIVPFVTPTAQRPSQTSTVKIARVIDGDTVELETGETLRYIGIDTPETKHPSKPVQCYGEEAHQANKKLVEGKNVRIVKDVSEVDKYKRLLRYVYVSTQASPSGILINDYLVRNGFAFATTFPPDVAMADQFLEAQREAQQNNRGLWKSCGTT